MSDSQDSKREVKPSQKSRSSEKDGGKKCLYVGNLNEKVDDKHLRELFEKHGEIDSIQMVYQPLHDTQGKEIPRGFAFITYKNGGDADRAKAQLHKFNLKGKELVVEFSKRRNARDKTPGRYLGFKNNRGRSRSRSYERRSRDHRRRSRSDSRGRRQKHRSRSHSRDRSRQRPHRSKRHHHHSRRSRSYSRSRS